MPPITIAYLAAVLERAGVEVQFYDDVLHRWDEATFTAKLKSFRPDLVGISVVTGTVSGAERAVAIVRRDAPDSRIVMGNIHADLFAPEFLRRGLADFVVHAEGEATLVALVQEMAKSYPDYASVEGISYLADGLPVRNKDRAYIENLDELPFPAWHLFPLKHYDIFNFARVKHPGTLILGSRGCPFKCTFCTLVLNQSTKRRRRSVGNIVDEVEYLHDRFGYRQVSFADPIFPFYRQEGEDFAAEMSRRGLHKKVVWITETRVDLVDYELLATMREGGLRRIMFGFETGSPEQLARIRKGARVDRGVEAARAARRAGVGTVGFFMLGIPGSTKADLDCTIDYATSVLDIDFAKFTVFVPYPGTPEYQSLRAAGDLPEPENWSLFTSYPTEQRPPAYVPRGLTANDLIQAQKRAYRRFYMRPGMVAHQLLKVRSLGARDVLNGLRLVAPFPAR